MDRRGESESVVRLVGSWDWVGYVGMLLLMVGVTSTVNSRSQAPLCECHSRVKVNESP